MKKISIYLDTSIINFVFADDAPEKQEVTIDFFENCIKQKIYDTFISPVVLDEINRTQNNVKKEKLLEVISKHSLQILDIESVSNEIKYLAEQYIMQEIIPQKKLEDALHIAISTIYQLDILLSWNYRHLANINKERKILALNLKEGYIKPFRIITPLEVSYNE